MHQDHLDMESVTLELDEEELDRIDDIAFANHRENREAAIRELLDAWLKDREQSASEEVDSSAEADSSENEDSPAE